MSYLGNSPQNALYGALPIALAQGQTVILASYTPGMLLLFKNGALLTLGTDYTAADGSTITLARSASLGDSVVVISLAGFSVANALPLSGGTLSGPANGVEPAQFDNSALLATTNFVQRALGNNRGVTVLSAGATTVLTAAQAGGVFLAQGGNITLPAVASVPVGATYTIEAAGTASLLPAGTDRIYVASTALASMPVVENVTVVAAQAATWIVVSGNASLPFSALFTGGPTTGHQNLPSGLIIQWGGIAGIAPSGTTFITYPIAFPNAFISLAGLPGATSGGNGGGYVFSATGGGSSLANAAVFNASPSFSVQGGTYIALGY
jgi:hypothetical protein